MKKYSFFIITFYFSFCFSQGNKINNEKISINKFLSIVKANNKYFFQGNNGEKKGGYDNIEVKDNGLLEVYIYVPTLDTITSNSNRCYRPDNSIRHTFHVLDLMKEMKIIDEYSFNLNQLTNENINKGIIDENGYASKNEKHCMVNSKGKFLNDFKFESQFFYNDKPLINFYKEKKSLITAVLNKFDGKELFKTKSTLIKYWDNNNYILKNNNNYFLCFEGKSQKVTADFDKTEYLPIESNIFTCNKKFFNLDGKQIASKYIPQSNFYKGFCIVLEIIEPEPKFDFYGKKIEQQPIKVYKIINAKFETIKKLENFYGIDGGFNKYGNIIASYQGDGGNYFVMNYLGNIVIPTSKCINKIKEVFEGLYEVGSRIYPSTNECNKNENFYNQFGDKILNLETLRIGNNFEFKEGIDENYIVSYGFKYVVLNKSNGVKESYYK